MKMIDKVKEIFSRIFNKQKRRNALIAGAAMGIAATAISNTNDQIPSPEPNTKEEITIATEPNKSFSESLRVTTSPENPKTPYSKLDTRDDILTCLKTVYADSVKTLVDNGTIDLSSNPNYERLYNELNPDNLKILSQPTNYMYVIDENTYVTHGENPYNIENALLNDGIAINSFSDEFSMDRYTITLYDSFVDSAYNNNEQNYRVIPGDDYSTLKNYTSVLSETNYLDIVMEGFHCIEEINTYNELSDNSKEKLTNSIEKYYSTIEQNKTEKYYDSNIETELEY